MILGIMLMKELRTNSETSLSIQDKARRDDTLAKDLQHFDTDRERELSLPTLLLPIFATGYHLCSFVRMHLSGLR